MKCNIVRDLLPLYCDKLTSQDSNEEIEKHLHECGECNAVYESMKKKEDDIKVPEKDVKPLKKVKKRTKLKVIGAVLGTTLVMFVAFMLIFVGGIPISRDKLHYIVKAREVHFYFVKLEPDENGLEREEYRADYMDNYYPVPEGTKVWTAHELSIDFKADCKIINELMYRDDNGEYQGDDEVHLNTFHDHVWYFPVKKLPFGLSRNTNEASMDYVTVAEGDTLTIHYLGKNETLDLWELYQENVEK